MSWQVWGRTLFQVAAWLTAYAALLVAHTWVERWLIARFLNQGEVSRGLGGIGAGPGAHQVVASIGSILVGAIIPLAPGLAPLDHTSAGVLFVLAAMVFLPLVSRGRLDVRSAHRNLDAATLLWALPIILIVLSAVMTTGVLGPYGEGSLRLDRLIEAQAGWSGLRWIGFLQPLAIVLWLACAPSLLGSQRTNPALVGQVLRLNLRLFSAALFLGGWQGPFVNGAAWLGLAYTGAKVLCLTFVWTWTAVSLPRLGLPGQVEVTWLLYVLSTLNLMGTAIVVAIGTR